MELQRRCSRNSKVAVLDQERDIWSQSAAAGVPPVIPRLYMYY